ncbi:MAG: hypothetical protein WC802_02700 [Patescibacteria group bacterium]|jgi:hypothetical protein
MKKIVLAFVALVLAGAGCVPVANKPIDGKWRLAFDLPSGWVMVEPYSVPGKTEKLKPLDENVKRDDSEIYLQSLDKAICWTGGNCAEGSATEGEQIKASALDSHRVLDLKELKDLGNGFYVRLDKADTYYLVTDSAKYQFNAVGDAEALKKIILSAKVVNHYTDRATIEVKSK